MQTNKWKIWDTVFKPSGLDPLVVTRCLIVWVSLTDHAIAKNYNTWKKLDEYEWWDAHQIDYRVIEEWREWISWAAYSEAALYETREAAMEYVYKKAKEILDIPDTDEPSNNQ
jgi:hypothetical protein